MEVNTKRGGWGRGQQDEEGRWVGRKKGSRWARVGRSFPRKMIIKLFPKKIELGKKNKRKKY